MADMMTKSLEAVAFYLYREASRHNALDYNIKYNTGEHAQYFASSTDGIRSFLRSVSYISVV